MVIKDVTKVKFVDTSVEKHIANSGGLFVHFEWVTGKHYALRDDASWIRVEEATHRNKMRT